MPNPTSFIRKTINTLLTSDEFKEFDGINYYFSISDEAIGIVGPNTQPSKYGGEAFFTPNVGIIHFRINCLLQDVLKNEPEWYWTLSSLHGYSQIPFRPKQLTFKNEEPTTNIKTRLQTWLVELKSIEILDLKTNFSNLIDIAAFIESSNHKDPKLSFAAQYLLHGQQALSEAMHYLAKLNNPTHWGYFQRKLELLNVDDIKVEDNNTARQRVFAAADARRTLILQDPPSRRPTF